MTDPFENASFEVVRPGPSREELLAEVTELQQKNDARLQALSRRGFQFDQASILTIRFQEFTDYHLGPLTPDPMPFLPDAYPRLAFELRVQKKFAEVLDNVESQISKTTLLQGVRTTLS